MRLYGLKNCDSCKKALKALQSVGQSSGQTVEFIDLRAVPVMAEQLQKWLDEHGDAVVCAQNFELRSGYPPKILSDSLENTLTDAKLENATVQVSMLS